MLSKAQARKVIINAAGLSGKSAFGTGIEAVYRVINKLGFVQLDTNYVVERAHHHVMAARIPNYESNWLEELCEDARVFEYFASDAGYIPMEDFRFTLPVKKTFERKSKVLSKVELSMMKQIMDQVERDGPVMVGDFENDREEASSGWWDWRPAKLALERLYLEGKLMIRRTKTFQKVYDLPLNVIPADVDQSMPSDQEYAAYVILRTLGALGIAGLKEMKWRARRVDGNLIKPALDSLLQSGVVKPLGIAGIKESQYVLANLDLDLKISDEVFILSPFDILNVFRHRLKNYFDFDYQIECFVPAAKRIYGYFSLPILAGDTFIARMDAKADRKQGLLIIHNLHFESVSIFELTLSKLIESLKAFVLFNNCRDIEFRRSNRETYLALIRKGFSL